MTSDKLGPKSDKYFFVGYPKETKGYYFYHQTENKIVVARNGVFLEKEFLPRRSSGSNIILEEVQDTSNDNVSNDEHINPQLDTSANMHWEEPNPQTVVEEVQVPTSDTSTQVEGDMNSQTVVDAEPEVQVLRRSGRTVHAPERYMGLHEISILDTEDPLTYAEALDRPDSGK